MLEIEMRQDFCIDQFQHLLLIAGAQFFITADDVQNLVHRILDQHIRIRHVGTRA